MSRLKHSAGSSNGLEKYKHAAEMLKDRHELLPKAAACMQDHCACAKHTIRQSPSVVTLPNQSLPVCKNRGSALLCNVIIICIWKRHSSCILQLLLIFLLLVLVNLHLRWGKSNLLNEMQVWVPAQASQFWTVTSTCTSEPSDGSKVFSKL